MAATDRTHDEEHAWIEAYREEFLDRWVALDGSNLSRPEKTRAPFMTKLARKVWTHLILCM